MTVGVGRHRERWLLAALAAGDLPDPLPFALAPRRT
jgi:hypothetical protein